MDSVGICRTEFFSVFITDYFLADPDAGEKFDHSPYSREELATLSERMDRIEDNSPFILSIPRLTLLERKEMMSLFINKYDFLNGDEFLQIVSSENGRSKLDFNGKLDPEVNQEWIMLKIISYKPGLTPS